MQITDLEADPEWGWVADILVKAREIMEETGGRLEPMLFCRRPGQLAICPLGQVGDYTTEEGKDLVAAAMRLVCRQTKATSCAFVTDAWITTMPDDAAYAAAAEVGGRWAELPEEVRKRARRREAIQVAVETLDRPLPRSLVQFYRREAGDKIVFEELIPPADNGPLAGRFSRILERPGPTPEMMDALMKEAEDLTRGDDGEKEGLVAAFVRTWRSLAVALGYTLHIGEARIDLIRADGTHFATVRREQAPGEFDELRKACEELQQEQRRL